MQWTRSSDAVTVSKALGGMEPSILGRSVMRCQSDCVFDTVHIVVTEEYAEQIVADFESAYVSK